MDTVGLLATGHDALRRARWREARECFEAALAVEERPEALDGLGTALWWLNEPAGGLLVRARAYAGYRRDGRTVQASRIAVWLAREYRSLFRRTTLADGWLARARGLVADSGDTATRGWVILAEAEAAPDIRSFHEGACHALTLARECGDSDLEILALAKSGACAVASGAVDVGLAGLDEAMTAGAAGEGRNPQYLAEALCTLVEVAGWVGDTGRLAVWASMLVDFGAAYDFGPLLPMGPTQTVDLVSRFCGACCGGVYLVTGRLDEAELQLTKAVAELAATGVHPRCRHPVAALAELRLAQGRLDEAEELLVQRDTLPECVAPAAALDLARHRPSAAVARLEAAVAAHSGEPVRLVPWWALLVDGALEVDAVEKATQAAAQISRVTALTESTLHVGHDRLAQGKVAAARGESSASSLLRAAALNFAQADAPLLACRARLALARALPSHDRGLAVTEARSALQTFERLGAGADADRAAAFLKGLGVRGRTGQKGTGLLTGREQEVLRLVAEGLSNPEIAERLFISVRTAGHHVSSILSKLGLRSRTEAAAYAVLHPVGSPAREPVRYAERPRR